MGKITFGSQVYTWFMQGTGKGYDNKLDHMIKVAAEAGFTGIEPMVLEISESALGCGKYWLGDFCDPKRLKDVLDEHNMKLAGLALVCAWDGETEAPNEKAAADFTLDFLKHFPGSMLGTVTLPSGRKDNLQSRRLNIANRFVLDGRAGNLQRGQVVKILGRITVGKVARDRNISHFYLPLSVNSTPDGFILIDFIGFCDARTYITIVITI